MYGDGIVFAAKGAKHYTYKFYYIDENGMRRQKGINTGVPINGSKKEARRVGREKAEAFKAEIGAKRNENLSFNANCTLEEFGIYWLGMTKGSVRENTWEEYKRTCEKHIFPRIGQLKIKNITGRDIEHYIDMELDECKLLKAAVDTAVRRNGGKPVKVGNGAKPFFSSIGKHVKLLGQIMDLALRDGVLKENPTKRIHKEYLNKIPKSSFHSQPYSVEEVKALIRAIKGHRIECAVMLAIYLGIRRSEICGLRWSDINFEKKVVIIRNTRVYENYKVVEREDNTKTELSRRSIPVPEGLYVFLHEERAKQEINSNILGSEYVKNDYVVVDGFGRPLKPDNVSRNFQKILEENGLRKIRFHDLRHTVGTVILENTNDLKLVSEILGHSQIETTANIYANTSLEYKRAGMNVYNSLLND